VTRGAWYLAQARALGEDSPGAATAPTKKETAAAAAAAETASAPIEAVDGSKPTRKRAPAKKAKTRAR
jgi:hypothetical protein